MKILVAGGTGLIGKPLVSKLVKNGHEVVVLTRNKGKSSNNAALTFEYWDGKSIAVNTVGSVDAVINLAGAGIAEHRWTDDYKAEILSSRVNATGACTQFCQAVHPAVYISASAVGYYGTKTNEPLEETAPPGTDFLAKTAVRWEAEAQNAGCRTVILRTGVVLSNDGGAFPQLLTPFKLKTGAYLGDGKQPFPWIHYEDVVDIIIFALDNPTVTGPINLVAPELHTNKSFGKELGHLLGVVAGLPVPAFVIRSMLGERAMLVLEGQMVSCKKIQNLGYHFKYPTATQALKQLLHKE